MLKEAIVRVVKGDDLTVAEMEAAMEEVMTGEATDAQIGAFITALRMKGESVDEIVGAARVMRAKAHPICLHGPEEAYGVGNGREEVILDTCGTGGDGANTFNVSTTTALVAAGAGVKVAKHGNRSVSSLCGSADVLESLGVGLEIDPADVGRCIREVGIGFLFAPRFHGAMKYAAGPRRELGLRTIFNLLGPLTNPAGATVQLVGVYAPDLTETVARVLGRLGTREAFVVHGEGNVDEVSICGPTRVSHLKEGQVRTYRVTPEACGLERATPADIRGGDAAENARIVRDILEGHRGPKRDMVLLNSAPAFVAAGLARDLGEGVLKAGEVIDSGRPLETLASLVAFTRECAVRAQNA